MKLIKYDQFAGLKPLNENLDKAKKFLKDRYMLRTAAQELGFIKGELKAQLDHGEKRSLTVNDFTPEQQEQLRASVFKMKLNDAQIKQIERDPEFLKLRELLKDNLGYLYNFTYMYYIEMVSLEEIKAMYNRLLDFGGLLDKLPKKFDANFIDPKIKSNAEVLADGLDTLEDHRKIKRVMDKLTPELKKDYSNSALAYREQFDEVARAFDSLGGKDEKEKDKLWKAFFGEVREIEGKKRYIGQLKRYKNIREFIKAAQNFLKASQNSDIIAFYDKVNKCNEKYGWLGADIVFDENNILILEVKSFPANQMLNGHTRHCIKDYSSQWDNYIASHNNKQYYIYNFNIPQYDNLSVIGITIEPGPKIRACHAKDDRGISGEFRSILKGWEKKYDIKEDLWEQFKPMTKDEIAKREKAKLAEREIIKKGLSIKQILSYVKEDGANINKNNCVALENAVEENDLEKAQVILDLGGNPNLKAKSEAIINKAKTLDMIKLLVANGSELTGEVFNNICDSTEAVEYCLKQGLDANFENSLPVRRCCKGSWKNKDEIGEGYSDVFQILVKYGAKLSDDGGRNMAIKWAAEYGRLDFIDFMIDHGVKDGFKQALTWLSHSRKIPEAKKQETIKYLQDKINKFEK